MTVESSLLKPFLVREEGKYNDHHFPKLPPPPSSMYAPVKALKSGGNPVLPVIYHGGITRMTTGSPKVVETVSAHQWPVVCFCIWTIVHGCNQRWILHAWCLGRKDTMSHSPLFSMLRQPWKTCDEMVRQVVPWANDWRRTLTKSQWKLKRGNSALAVLKHWESKSVYADSYEHDYSGGVRHDCSQGQSGSLQVLMEVCNFLV